MVSVTEQTTNPLSAIYTSAVKAKFPHSCLARIGEEAQHDVL